MAHYFESGFFIRDKAWHGLGKVLQAAPTTADALVYAGLDWPVETIPSYAEIGGRYVEVPDAKHVVRHGVEDDPEILGTVGARWTPLQNREAFSWFDPLVHEGNVSLEAAGAVRGGRNVWILARINDSSVSVGQRSDDLVNPYLLLSNAHDGSRAVTVAFTPIRVVCWNTLSAAHSAADQAQSGAVKLRHTRNLATSLVQLREQIDLERRNFEAKALVWRELAERPVEKADEAADYVRRVFGEQKAVKKALDLGEELPEVRAEKHVARLFVNGPGADSAGRTWFGLYMAATHYIDHERGRTTDSRLASTWFGPGAETRDRAETVALELAGV